MSGQLADKNAQLQQACQNPLFSPEKPQPGSPSTPRDRGLDPELSSLTLQVQFLSINDICKKSYTMQSVGSGWPVFVCTVIEVDRMFSVCYQP